MRSIEEKKRITDGNIRNSDEEISNALEKRAAHLREKAEIAAEGSSDEPENTYRNAFFGTIRQTGCLKENEKYVSAIRRAIGVFDRINTADVFLPDGDETLYFGEDEEDGSSDTVIYLRNAITDEAYSAFAKVLRDPRVIYGEAFADICEEVYYGRAAYCILPLESSEDGRLSGFGNMIRKYELKIVLTCSVEDSGGKTTIFALLKKELGRIRRAKSRSDGEYLEIVFNPGREHRPDDVLSAAAYFGFSLNRIDSIPIQYSENDYGFCAVFKGPGETVKFLKWLDLEMPGYEIIGIYEHIVK